MLGVIEGPFRLYKHIFDVDLHGFSQQRSEYLSYQPLISYPGIFQAERYHVVAV